jgi:hypothetical protein
MMLSRKIIVRKLTLQTNNKFFFYKMLMKVRRVMECN